MFNYILNRSGKNCWCFSFSYPLLVALKVYKDCVDICYSYKDLRRTNYLVQRFSNILVSSSYNSLLEIAYFASHFVIFRSKITSLKQTFKICKQIIVALDSIWWGSTRQQQFKFQLM